jgi:hypothetical protein
MRCKRLSNIRGLLHLMSIHFAQIHWERTQKPSVKTASIRAGNRNRKLRNVSRIGNGSTVTFSYLRRKSTIIKFKVPTFVARHDKFATKLRGKVMGLLILALSFGCHVTHGTAIQSLRMICDTEFLKNLNLGISYFGTWGCVTGQRVLVPDVSRQRSGLIFRVSESPWIYFSFHTNVDYANNRVCLTSQETWSGLRITDQTLTQSHPEDVVNHKT